MVKAGFLSNIIAIAIFTMTNHIIHLRHTEFYKLAFIDLLNYIFKVYRHGNLKKCSIAVKKSVNLQLDVMRLQSNLENTGICTLTAQQVYLLRRELKLNVHLRKLLSYLM